MKLTNLLFILLFVVLFISRESFSQEVKPKENKPQEINYNVSALIGQAAYSWPTYGGGGLSGTNYSLSGGIQLSENVNFAIRADYTSFSIKNSAEGYISVSYQPNPIYSFSGEIIPKLWGINLILGAGVSSQKNGAVQYHYYNSQENRRYTEQADGYVGADGPKFHGVLGFSGDIKLIKELSLLVQTRFFIGNYSGWILETGLKYNF